MKPDNRPTAIAIGRLRGPLHRLAALATGVLLLLDGSAAAAQQAPPDAPHARPGEPCGGSQDWPYLCRYRDQNAAILRSGVRPQVVFLGDSITEYWRLAQPDLFGDKIVDRGISGQTTPQILLRFYADVVALHPRVVHIMAGTNDIAGNTGPMSDDQIFDNIRAMLDIAAANHIKVVLASITPAAAGDANHPAARILAINARLRQLAAHRGAIFVDYHTPMSDERHGISRGLADDGLHPNRDGYAVMRPLAERALAEALR